MMKIALFSDIHANLPAFHAFLKDVESRDIDAMYCLGDLVGYNIWPNEIINEIRKRKIPTLAGNHDFDIARMSPITEWTSDYEQTGKVSTLYTNFLVKAEERKYLRTLPAHIRLNFQLNEDSLTLLLVHGSPRKINEYLLEDKEETSMLEIMEEADADILCFGHSHKPYHRILSTELEGKKQFCHAINIGSVGKPKDNDARGCYVILSINENSTKLNAESIQVAFIRFEYDIETAAKAIENSPLSNNLAEMLRKGF